MQTSRKDCEGMEMYCYVLFVQAGRERKVEQFLRKLLDIHVFVPFVPSYERLFKISGTVKKELKALFPGYVFIESEVLEQEFLKIIGDLIHISNNIISILRYSDTEIAMRESERRVLFNLWNPEHCIAASIGIIEGDKIHITKGPLKGYESRVRKINRHKRQAWIELEFMGDIRLVAVPLEIIGKVV